MELLKQIAPQIKRVGIFRDSSSSGGVAQFAAIQGAATSFAVEAIPLDVRTAADIERGMADFARMPNGGIVVTASSSAAVHRKLLVQAANQHRLPSVYPTRVYVDEGGLSSYGIDPIEPYRRAASYVDRILKGEKPAQMPVQQPTKFELIINVKTASAIGLKIPQTVLLRADRIIE